MLNFFKFAAEREGTSSAGIVNLAGMALIAFMIAAAGEDGLVRAILDWLERRTDRLAHLIERYWEYRADRRGGSFKAVPLSIGARSGGREAGVMLRQLIGLGIFTLACVLVVGAISKSH